MLYLVPLAWAGLELTMLVVIGTDYISSYKPNYQLWSYGKLDLQLPVQSMPITTKVVSSNRVQDEVYSKQHYVIKFENDFRQVGDKFSGHSGFHNQ